MPVHLALLDTVVVSTRPLVRGQAGTADDVTLSEVDTSTLHKSLLHPRRRRRRSAQQARAVGGGTTLHAGLLERARLVKRGSQVQILAVTDGLQVRMRGKALADGTRGERIKVKNLSSGREVTGRDRLRPDRGPQLNVKQPAGLLPKRLFSE